MPLKSFSKTKLSILVLFFVGLLIAALWTADVLEDRSYSISITEPVGLYPECETAGTSFTKPIKKIQPGANAKILRICYSKNWPVAKVRLDEGEEGWIPLGDGANIFK